MSHAGRRATLAALLLLVPAALGGCGTGTGPSPAAGVDGLVIPTPAPEQADFVTGIDNPWLAYEVGSETTYAVSGSAVTTSVVVTVAAGPQVDRVATTAVTATSTAADLAHTDYYAQDRAGNVWWFGREGEWQAGTGGVEAGLLMAATPRFGDGYRSALAPGVDLVADVVAVDSTVAGSTGDYDHVVVIDTTDSDGQVERAWYARGVGLVHQATLAPEDGAADVVLELTQR
ncbi:hypothetical protein BH11ACT8_BH11ACT8_19970 [soil metagenome]